MSSEKSSAGFFGESSDYSPASARSKRKNRLLAVILGLVFGPFGMLYFGWAVLLTTLITYFVVSILALLPVCLFYPYRLPPVWYSVILNLFFGFWGFMLASLHNEILENMVVQNSLLHGETETVNLVGLNVMCMTWWLVRVISWTMGLYLSFMLFFEGRWIIALLTSILVIPFVIRCVESARMVLMAIVTGFLSRRIHNTLLECKEYLTWRRLALRRPWTPAYF